MNEAGDKHALIDLDGTVADYDADMERQMASIRAPGEPPAKGKLDHIELPHETARRKMIQRIPGFWRDLPELPMGFEVIEELRALGFMLHVLTKGPNGAPNAWSEKAEWCREHLPDALVTISQDKSLVYGRVLFDDFPPYFEKWLSVRPRGLVVCLAHPWNQRFSNGAHPNVLRYEGTNRYELRERLIAAYDRKGGEA